MSGETERDVSGWTVDTLRQHLLAVLEERDRRFEQRFLAQQEATDQAVHSAEKATEKSEAATERRFESVNEFRGQLQDQATKFMGRDESLARHAESHVRTDVLGDRVTLEIGRLNDRITELDNKISERLNLLAGQREGQADATARRRAEVSQLVAIISVVFIGISVAVAVILAFNG